MLRPVQEISAVARRLSASTLHERIDLKGPKDELGQLADTFDAMLGRLEAAFDAQREFVSNASHELRTPLAIMRTELDVTLADPATDADDLRRMAETIRDAIARSEDVIDKLLVLAESEELAERDAVDMARRGRQASSRQHARAADARGISFRVRRAAGDRERRRGSPRAARRQPRRQRRALRLAGQRRPGDGQRRTRAAR